MEAATLRRTLPPLPGLIQVGLVALLLLLASAGWVLTDDRMDGMDAGPGTDLGGLGWFIGAWVTMMTAMMLPSIAPMVLTYARIEKGNREPGRTRPSGATAVFVAGYLVSWSTAGLLGYMIVEGVGSLDVGFLAWEEGGPYVAGAVILGAALYQLTALKGTCLRQCRGPGMFFLQHWRPGSVGALRMGIEHGGVCVGCCWALMAALFALGVMSIGWMAFIAALIGAEKLLPWRTVANRGIAVLLAALGLAVALAPEDVPGLTIPGAPEAVQAIDATGVEAERGGMSGESLGAPSRLVERERGDVPRRAPPFRP
jgi:predicted metal-binding membrane protein